MIGLGRVQATTSVRSDASVLSVNWYQREVRVVCGPNGLISRIGQSASGANGAAHHGGLAGQGAGDIGAQALFRYSRFSSSRPVGSETARL